MKGRTYRKIDAQVHEHLQVAEVSSNQCTTYDDIGYITKTTFRVDTLTNSGRQKWTHEHYI